eukprot:scpid106938/ scgid25762/ 
MEEDSSGAQPTSRPEYAFLDRMFPDHGNMPTEGTVHSASLQSENTDAQYLLPPTMNHPGPSLSSSLAAHHNNSASFGLPETYSLPPVASSGENKYSLNPQHQAMDCTDFSAASLGGCGSPPIGASLSSLASL